LNYRGSRGAGPAADYRRAIFAGKRIPERMACALR